MSLHVESRGEGPDLVLIHGRASSSATWEPFLPYLEEFRLHLVDLPGHGRSPAPGEVADYTVERQTDAVEQALAALPDGFGLVGHSMGGFVAIRYALRHPGRLGCLVLEATAARDPFRGGRHRKYAEQALHQAEIARTRGMQALVDHLESRNELHPDQGPRLLAMQPLAYHGVIEANRQMEDLEPRLARLRVPTLVALGLGDAIFEPECRRLAERIPGARELVLAEAAHSPHREAAEAFGREVAAFLREHLARRGRVGARA